MSETDPPAWSDPVRRRRPLLIGALVTILLIAGAVVWQVENDGMSVGDRRATANLSGIRLVTVEVPAGSVDVTLAAPVETVDLGKETLAAPDGGRLVGVSWSTNPDLYRLREDSVTSVAVVANGRRYPLADLHPARLVDQGEATVAVAGDGSDVAVEVTVAGESQRVSTTGAVEKGRMASLYRNLGVGYCEVPRPDRTFGVAALCGSGEVVRTPYLIHRGWAPVGRSWMTVSGHVVKVDRAVLHSEAAGRTVELRPIAVTVGGTPSAGVSQGIGEPGQGQSLDRGQRFLYPDAVFNVPDDETLEVRLPVTFTVAAMAEPSSQIPSLSRIDLTPTFTVEQR